MRLGDPGSCGAELASESDAVLQLEGALTDNHGIVESVHTGSRGQNGERNERAESHWVGALNEVENGEEGARGR